MVLSALQKIKKNVEFLRAGFGMGESVSYSIIVSNSLAHLKLKKITDYK